MAQDLWINGIICLTIALSLVLVKIISKKYPSLVFVLRKLLHLFSGILTILILVLTSNFWISLILPTVCLIVNLLQSLNKFNYFDEKIEKHNFGTFYFSVITIICILCARINAEWRMVSIMAIAVMSICDPAAALVGHYIKKHNYRLSNGKSIFGSLAFFVSSAIVQIVGYTILGVQLKVDLIVAISMTVTTIEASSERSSDNLFVPAFFVLAYFVLKDRTIVDCLIICFHALLSLFCLFNAKLTGRAVSVTFLTTFGYFFFVGPIAYITMISFAIIGVFAGKIFKHPHNEECRNAIQVICNSAPATVFCILFYFWNTIPLFVPIFACFAACLADTIASTVGITSATPPKNILTREPMTPGLSGGVTKKGTIAGSIASIFMTSFFIVYAARQLSPLDVLFYSLIIAVCGILGMVLDSILGVYQIKYKCPTCQKLTESSVCCNQKTVYFSGNYLISNNSVNLISATAATVLSFGLSYIVFAV